MKMSPLERIWSKVDKSGECWLWTGSQSRGYGRFTLRPRGNVLVHRYVYEQLVGPIPDGYEIDHLCVVPLCVRPDHLEAVTPYINNLRSNGIGSQNRRKTHCIHGHEFTPENTYIRRLGWRECYTCIREKMNRRNGERSAMRQMARSK